MGAKNEIIMRRIRIPFIKISMRIVKGRFKGRNGKFLVSLGRRI